MPQAKTTTTVVRTAVARFESTCATPTLASRAVAAAKTAERRAQPTQVMIHGTRDRLPEGPDGLDSTEWRRGARAKLHWEWRFGGPRTS